MFYPWSSYTVYNGGTEGVYSSLLTLSFCLPYQGTIVNMSHFTIYTLGVTFWNTATASCIASLFFHFFATEHPQIRLAAQVTHIHLSCINTISFTLSLCHVGPLIAKDNLVSL